MTPEFRELEAEKQGCAWNLSRFHSLYPIRTMTLAERVSLGRTGHPPPSGVPALFLHPLAQPTKHHVECSALTLDPGAAGSLAGSSPCGVTGWYSQCASLQQRKGMRSYPHREKDMGEIWIRVIKGKKSVWKVYPLFDYDNVLKKVKIWRWQRDHCLPGVKEKGDEWAKHRWLFNCFSKNWSIVDLQRCDNLCWTAKWLRDGKESVHSEGDLGSIPRSGTSPGGGHGNPLQYSCLENPTDRRAWWATVHGVAQSRMLLKRLSSSNT